jgi:hypothetical protein
MTTPTPSTSFQEKAYWINNPSDPFVIQTREAIITELCNEKTLNSWPIPNLIENTFCQNLYSFDNKPLYIIVKSDYIDSIIKTLNFESILALVKYKSFVTEEEFVYSIIKQAISNYSAFYDTISRYMKDVINDEIIPIDNYNLLLYKLFGLLSIQKNSLFEIRNGSIDINSNYLKSEFYKIYKTQISNQPLINTTNLNLTIKKYKKINILHPNRELSQIIDLLELEFTKTTENLENNSKEINLLNDKLINIEESIETNNCLIKSNHVKQPVTQSKKKPKENISYETYKFNKDSVKLKQFYNLAFKTFKIIDCKFSEFEKAFSGITLTEQLEIKFLIPFKKKHPNKVALIQFIKALECNKLIKETDSRNWTNIFVDHNGKRFKNIPHSMSNAKKMGTERNTEIIDNIISALLHSSPQ